MELDISWQQVILVIGPSVLVFLTAFLAFKQFFRSEERKAFHQMRLENRQTVLPVQMQAYERVVLLMERLSPSGLLSRFQDQDNMIAAKLHMLLLQAIRQEFDHNLTQQVYVTDEAWNAVQEARTDLIQLLNQAASETPANAPSQELSKNILNKMVELDSNPTEEALEVIKQEARRSFLG